METIDSLDGLPLASRNRATGRTTLLAVTSASSRARRRDMLPLSEAIPLWFAMSSPLIGLIIGFLGAWVVTWLTS